MSGFKIRNAIKQALTRQMAIRENVHVGAGMHVGPGSVIWAPKRLLIGNDVYVGKHVTIQVDGVIGDGVLFANGSGVVGKLDHDYKQVGATVRHARWVGDHPDLSSPTTIGSDVWIGFNAVVYSGTTIGDSSIIAAGSVVTTNIPPNSIAVGSPAKVIRPRFTDAEFELHWETLEKTGVRKVDAMNHMISDIQQHGV